MIPIGSPYRRIEMSRDGLRLVTATVTAPAQEAKALIRVRLAGICRSDLKEITGERSVRSDFGHEIIGEVVAADPLILPIGTPVVYDPHPRVRRTTGFAELMEIEGTRDRLASALVPIPQELARDVGVFIEPLSCAVHCVRRMELVGRMVGTDREPVAVIGAGMAGVLIAGVLRGQGIHVRLFNPSPDRLNDLRRRGVLTDCLAPGPPLRNVYPTVVLATALATRPVMELALSALAESGSLILFAGTHEGFSHSGLDLDAVRREERIARAPWGYLAGTYGAVRTDFELAIQFLSEALHDDTTRLINGRVTLPEAADLMWARARTGLQGKTIVDPFQV